jgi:glycosyltransferase involved in cell wall biosynthesis
MSYRVSGYLSERVLGEGRKKRVAVVYHIWPHYRIAVAEAMDRCDRIEYTFVASGENFQGIKHADMQRVRRFKRAPFKYFGSVMWQPEALRFGLRGYDAIIYLGDIHFVSTWLGALAARVRRTAVLFWAHGWLRQETPAKTRIRNLFYGLANGMLLYSERGKSLGALAGYPEDKLTVVYNSLDVAQADDIIQRIEAGKLASHCPRTLFTEPGLPLLICSARITESCRFDLLLDAAAKLAGRKRSVNVLLIGDGPARPSLEAQARSLGVSVHWFGACYDEEIVGQLIYHADITVSPGKIGLTAMHSLMNGTPAITHGHLDQQMPEVEAIEPGRTGLLFTQGDPNALADAIAEWLDGAPNRAVVRAEARALIHGKWNPEIQARIIERVVLELVGE